MGQLDTEEQLGKRPPEQVLVRRWRRQQFSELGFDGRDARLLANSRADLGQVRRLIHAGCPPPTARAIVL